MSAMKVVLTTCPDKPTAEKISRALVDQKLAACVQVSQPVSSFYVWQGKTVEDTEYQVVIKTIDSKVNGIFEAINALHPFDVPQLITLDSVSGSQQYLEWIKSSLQ